ncbi:MAG: hypothetical protein V4616_11295 [Bacteroidota bacterium]
MNLKNLLASALLLLSGYTYAQPADLVQPYFVSTTDDTVMCSVIKLKDLSITCQSGEKKIEMRNEFIRRIYLPVEKSQFDTYFQAYADKGTERLYPYGPKTTGKIIAQGHYPRFFDMRPLDAEKDFWTRGLFEILAQRNGYKLCKIRNKSAKTSFGSTSDGSELDKYYLFEENEATGVELNKNNFAREIVKLTGDCPSVKRALGSSEVNAMKDVPAFLVAYATCN